MELELFRCIDGAMGSNLGFGMEIHPCFPLHDRHGVLYADRLAFFENSEDRTRFVAAAFHLCPTLTLEDIVYSARSLAGWQRWRSSDHNPVQLGFSTSHGTYASLLSAISISYDAYNLVHSCLRRHLIPYVLFSLLNGVSENAGR